MKFLISNFKFLIVFFTFYILHFTFYIPAYAQVPIKDYFGFGNIGSLGEGTTRLVVPFFEIAAVLVIAYFLVGAFRYLKAASDKEEIEGARQMITHAIAGFIILMFAFLMLQFLLSSLFGFSGLEIIQGK